eukprot:jgi/Ulvmu1/6615/UM003_0252.1
MAGASSLGAGTSCCRQAARPSRVSQRRAPITAAAAAEAPATEGPIILDGQVLHSIEPHRLDIIHSMEKDGWVDRELSKMLKPVENSWQPADYLPDPASDTFLDEVAELRKRTNELPDDYLVTLVGDMITEEGLPTYMTMLNTLDGVRDETGASSSPWAQWTRKWTAEENRHGDLLNKYLYLSGRVDMRAIEVTIQNLIGSGMAPKTENNPYLGFVYTSFQERATKVSHGHTASEAGQHGDAALQKVCGVIAADESRHEIAYTKIVDELFVRDPDGAMLAFADMMRKQIVMPAHLMNDNEHGLKNDGRSLFADFSDVAQRLGVYTAKDYADIMRHLVRRWGIAERSGLSGEAAKAQGYLVKLPDRIDRLSERAMARKSKGEPATGKFSWVYDRPVELL